MTADVKQAAGLLPSEEQQYAAYLCSLPHEKIMPDW
jgi:hypothetical protein